MGLVGQGQLDTRLDFSMLHKSKLVQHNVQHMVFANSFPSSLRLKLDMITVFLPSLMP